MGTRVKKDRVRLQRERNLPKEPRPRILSNREAKALRREQQIRGYGPEERARRGLSPVQAQAEPKQEDLQQ